MEHLPIVIFEIVLSVFIAFAIFAEILLKQIINQQKKIKKLESELDFQIQKYSELEKFVHYIQTRKWLGAKLDLYRYNDFKTKIQD
jgi:hypothetical protein